MKAQSIAGLLALCISGIYRTAYGQAEIRKWVNPQLTGSHLFGIAKRGPNTFAIANTAFAIVVVGGGVSLAAGKVLRNPGRHAREQQEA